LQNPPPRPVAFRFLFGSPCNSMLVDEIHISASPQEQRFLSRRLDCFAQNEIKLEILQVQRGRRKRNPASAPQQSGRITETLDTAGDTRADNCEQSKRHKKRDGIKKCQQLSEHDAVPVDEASNKEKVFQCFAKTALADKALMRQKSRFL
jgi:hypothetical protein